MSDFVLKILDFINEYYHVMIVFIMVIMLVIACFKPNKKNDFMRVFKLVNKAEELFPEPGSGATKLAYVISQLKDLDTEYVINAVDEILSSPEKKI